MSVQRKEGKYECLTAQNHIFKALAFETLGPCGMEIKEVMNIISKALVHFSGNKKVGSYLKQSLAIAIQRGSAASILGTLPAEAELKEVNFTYISYFYCLYLFKIINKE